MKSCDQSRDRSNQIGTISDHYFWVWLSHQLPDLPNQSSNFRINLSDQPFESTFWINLLNQPFESTYAISLLIKLAAPLACGTSFLQTYVRRIVLLPTEVRIIQVVDLFADHPLVKAWSVSPSSNTLVAVWMKVLLDVAKDFSLVRTSASSSGKSERRE